MTDDPMRNLRRTVSLALCALILLVGSASADLSFDKVTWGHGGDTLGWYTTNGVAAALSPAVDGNPYGWLLMSFDANPAPFPVFETDSLVVTNEGYIGNYDRYSQFGMLGPGVKFDFLGYPSSAQALFFESAGGSRWAKDFQVHSHTWESHMIDFNGIGWAQVTGAETFQESLRHVDLVGFIVEHLNFDDAFDYGVDNWQYVIPEPGATAMMLTVLLAVGGTFRKEIRDRFRRMPATDEKPA